MKAARAAELWARLEKKLIERCGLPDGHMLDRERPGLVRTIGNMLSGKAAAGEPVSPPLPQQRILEAPAIQHRRIARGMLMIAPDTNHDPKLAAMLDRACSRRTGYDGDDSVGYS